jgi:hypothetical protein
MATKWPIPLSELPPFHEFGEGNNYSEDVVPPSKQPGSDPRPKSALDDVSDHLLSVCKLLHLPLLLQNHWVNFNEFWHKSFFGEGIQICSNEGEHLSLRVDNSKWVKIHWKFKKKSFPEPASKFQSNLVQIILGYLGNSSVSSPKGR